jgi:hypothetical protein
MARGTTAYITVLSAATGDPPDAGLEQVTPIDALVNYSRPYSGSLASPQRAMFSQPSQSRAIQDSVRSDYDRHVPGSRRAMTVYMPFLSIFRAWSSVTGTFTAFAGVSAHSVASVMVS